MGSVPMLRRRIRTGRADRPAPARRLTALPRALLWRAEWSRPTRARDRRAGRPSCRRATEGWSTPSKTSESSAAGKTARTALQVGLLQKALVLVRHQVRLDLRDEVHHHYHHDQQRRAAEVERGAELA